MAANEIREKGAPCDKTVTPTASPPSITSLSKSEAEAETSDLLLLICARVSLGETTRIWDRVNGIDLPVDPDLKRIPGTAVAAAATSLLI